MAGTSLAEQLKRLAVPQTSILVHTKKRLSLLFDPREAADISRDTFYKIGVSGLEELITLESRFSEFEDSLFDETSQHLERAVEDQQANAKLDKVIHRFLVLLSPFVNRSAAHKALEWLICRFHIHQYNVDSILILFLPYHETNIFARMVQILSLQEKGGRWLWLQPLKKEGIPMSKLFLLSHLSSDPSFLKFVCSMPLQGVQVWGERSFMLSTMFAFYCTSVIGALDHSLPVSEVQVTHLLPSLIAGINSSHVDFTAAAFMILGHLVSKIHLTSTIFTELFYKVSKCEQVKLRSEAVLVLVVMTQSNSTILTLASVSHLALCEWFLPTLSQLAAAGVVVYPLVACFTNTILSTLCKSVEVSCDEDQLQEFLTKLLHDTALTNEEAAKLFKIFAEGHLKNNQWYDETLSQLEKSYPDAYDKAVKLYPVLVMSSSVHTGRNDLFQRLNHPETTIRLEAIKHIRQHEELLKEGWVREGLMARLSDNRRKVVSAVLALVEHLPHKQLPEQLTALAARCWHADSSMYSLGPVVLGHLQNTKRVDTTQLVLLTLPFLLPTTEKQLDTTKGVLNCAAVKKSKFLEPYKATLEKKIEETRLAKQVYNILKEGLTGLDLDSVLKAGEQLRAHGVVYQLMTALVGAGVLIQDSSFANCEALLNFLTQYNSDSAISSESSDPNLNEKNITSLLSMCRKGKLPFQGGASALFTLINNIEIPSSTYNRIRDITEPSAALVVKVFTLILKMKSSKNNHISTAYSGFFDCMVEKLETNEQEIEVVSNIALGCPELRTPCVAYLRNWVDAVEGSVSESVLVPTLLVTLHSPEEQCRHNALTLLDSLAHKLRTEMPMFHALVDHLTHHAQEISIDHEQVNVALYLCLSPDPSVQSLLDKSTQDEMANVRNGLMELVVAEETPAYVKSALLATLDQVNSPEILRTLLPLGMRILLSEKQSADEMSVLKSIIQRVNITTAASFKENHVWTFVEACLKDQKPRVVDCSIPAVMMLQQVDRELFAALDSEQQERLVSMIVESVAETEQSDVASAASSSFKRISLGARIAAKLLQPMRDFTPPVVQSGVKKRGWSVKQPPPLTLLTSTPWKQGLCLLEFIQNKKKLENVQDLLPVLFEILNRCLQFEEQGAVEYTKQVLLTALLHCCTKLTPESVSLPEACLQVELVVECVRVSSNPQTHHHALLLLAHMATMTPERVLHSVMPIFTFMGSSVLRQDDAYSFQIISKIIETIVPVLLQDRSEKEQLSVEVVGVLRVFAGTLLDIPEHRRSSLFTKLLTTLGEARFLWTFLSLVFESHVLHPYSSATGKDSGSIPKRLEVGLQLCHQFSPNTILSTASQLIQYLCQLPVDKGDKKRVEEFKSSSFGPLFDVDRNSDKQLRHYTYTALTFLSMLLSSKHFLRLMAELSVEEIQELSEIFQHMFEGILTLTQMVSKQVDVSAGQITAKYWKSMFNICFDVLAKTNALLPGDMFLAVICQLLEHRLVTLRCKSLELLNWRLQQGQTMDPERLLSLLSPLLSLVKVTELVDQQSQVMQQTALLSIKFLARHLAAEHPDHFQPVLKTATKLVKKGFAPEPVVASAILCIGELAHTLGAHAIIHLPSFMPAVLGVMQTNLAATSCELLIISVVSAVNKIVESLAPFLSPYLDQLLQSLCVLTASANADNPKLQPVSQKIKLIRQKLSTDVPLRVLLPAVSESYSQLVSTNQTQALPSLLSLLADSFKAGVSLTPELTTFFLSALDYRCLHQARGDIDPVESAVISAIISLVFKLSESSFRPFYYKIFNWAFQSEGHWDRGITFYKLTYSIAESLKGLFVSFAHYFLKNAAALLEENNKVKQELKCGEKKASELVEGILRALHTVFIHDASRFVNKERFETLMQPLVDQLENQLGSEEDTEQRVSSLVIPCLTQMAVSAADDTLWKQLNYQILLKTRHTHPQVRIGGVLAVCEIAKKLGEEFLPLLPETVPFLAELLEDEDERVEKTSQRVVQELESALGEPISKYF